MLRTPGEVIHPMEANRLAALRALEVLDTPIEARFERITRLACKAFEVPIAAISCVDLHRQWFKSIRGLEIAQTERCVSFCQHAILQEDVFVVPDAREDELFADNPLVTGEPGVVFYAGTQIRSREGLPVATLCLIDTKPREFNDCDREALRAFGQLVERELHTPRTNPIEAALISQVGESWRSMLTDPLTRVWNHEGIALLITESLRIRTSQYPTGAAIMSLDAYEHICTTRGPVHADAFVRSYANEAQLMLDDGDAMGRLRGGEFAVTFHDPESDEQMQEKLRSLIELADRMGQAGDTAHTHAFGLWFDSGPIDKPERILERLTDGLETLRRHPTETLLVRPYKPGGTPSEAA